MSNEQDTAGDADAELTAMPAQQSQQQGNGKRKFLLIGLALVVAALTIAYATYWLLVKQYYVSTDDAYVESNRVMLMPRVAGTVVDIRVENTQWVEHGDVLVKLDPTDARLAVQKAEAQLANTVREVARLYNTAAQLDSSVRLKRAEQDQAHKDFERDQRLLKTHSVSREQFEHSRTAWEMAQASLAVARHQLAATRSLVANTTLPEHASVKLAESELRRAWLDLQRTRVVAPVTGYVAQRSVQLGQIVSPGAPLLSIVPLDQIWVDANFKETQLAEMRIGQAVELTADLYGGDVTYKGHVAGLSAGTGSAFELLPAQNATGNWIKVVRRVPVRIRLDRNQLQQHPLRVGLSMSVRVDLHQRESDTLTPVEPVDTGASTAVYAEELGGIGVTISRIIAANTGDLPASEAAAAPSQGQSSAR